LLGGADFGAAIAWIASRKRMVGTMNALRIAFLEYAATRPLVSHA
jgi:hypothetical protein